MRLTKFSSGDANCRVKIRLLSDGIEIGYAISTATQLLDNNRLQVLKGKAGKKTGGVLEFRDYNLIEVPGFIEYLRSGW